MNSTAVMTKRTTTVRAGPPLMLAMAQSEAAPLAAQLRELNFEVLPPAHSIEELEYLSRRLAPALLLVDVNFSGDPKDIESSCRLADALDIPVLHFAADADSRLIERTLIAGSCGLITVPIDSPALFAFVQSAIAQHHSLKQERIESRHLLAVLRSIGDAVIAVNRQLEVTFMNPAAESLTAHNAEESFFKNLFTVLDFQDAEAQHQTRQRFLSILDQGIASALPNSTIPIGRCGEHLLIADSVSPILKEDGSVDGLAIVLRSRTDREDQKGKCPGESLARQVELESGPERVRKTEVEFVSVPPYSVPVRGSRFESSPMDLDWAVLQISHDLQEPLRTLMLSASLLERQTHGFDPDTAAFVTRVKQTCAGMEKLVRDVLDFTRATQSREARPVEMNVKEALNLALGNLAAGILESQAEIVIDHRFPELLTGPPRLGQVFQNLIANAIRYRKPIEHPIIFVSAQRRGPDWIFSIRDNGIGFKPEQAAKLFAPFQRLNVTNVSGTGIGLATCKAIIEQNGGSIWAEAEPQVGATFHFTLPSWNCLRCPVGQCSSIESK